MEPYARPMASMDPGQAFHRAKICDIFRAYSEFVGAVAARDIAHGDGYSYI